MCGERINCGSLPTCIRTTSGKRRNRVNRYLRANKALTEDEARLFNINTGIPAPSARLVNGYATQETNAHLILAILEQIKAGSRSVDLGNLTLARDFTHASDAAEGIITFATRFDGDHCAYNIGTGTKHTVQEVLRRLERPLRSNRTKSASARATAHILNPMFLGWTTNLAGRPRSHLLRDYNVCSNRRI